MSLSSIKIALVFPLLAVASQLVVADETKSPVRKTSGLEKRTPWTTSKIQGSPDPASPYRTVLAFPKLTKFFEPLHMTSMPGANRFVVAERPGKIFSFANRADVTQADLLLDVGRTTFGVVLHPKFADNGFVYVYSVLDAKNPSDNGTRLSRYTVTRRDPPTADPKSETLIMSWPSGGHNGGCMQFGPDSFLYISTGDGSGIADQRETGQDISDVLGSILRIDVDRAADGKPYAIPADNPFVKTPGARPEVFAYGIRQAWKFSFDSATGRIWAGEVGQDLWEMVYLIEKGGNYGWSVTEGTHPFRPERKVGPTPILKPIVEHSHADFRSITGGYVYHGSRLPELKGAYLYGDYDTGKIWSLRYDVANKKVIEHRELDDTQLRIVSFAQDAAGEVFVLDFTSGGVHHLQPAPAEAPTAPFPRRLSETGLFASTKTHTVAPGVIPYSVNAELWSDGAKKERFLAIPGDGQIGFDDVTYPQPAPGAEPGWRFPHDTVLVKTFALELEPGNPQSRRRLETRILHHKKMPGTEEYGDQFWRGYTYIWNDDQTDAELLGSGSLDREYSIRDAAAPGGIRKQTWHFPSRAECTLCHTMSAKYALGVHTMQMNRDHDYGGTLANQLATLEHIGLFTKPLPKRPETLPKLVDYRDSTQDVTLRARSYLHANCAHCHRKWGGGNADFQLLAGLPLNETGTLNTRPGQGLFNLNDPKILVAGDTDRSMVLHRMQKLGLGRMPHIASTVVDQDAVKVMAEWIKRLANEEEVKRTGVKP